MIPIICLTGPCILKRSADIWGQINKNADMMITLIISPIKIVIQPVEKIIYDPNSSTRLKNIKRHETELKWIKFLQSPFPLGFNDNIYHEDNISKMPDFDVFLFWNVKNVKVDIMVNVKMAT